MRFLSAVDRKATVYRPWTGLITVDTLDARGRARAARGAGQPGRRRPACSRRRCWPRWTASPSSRPSDLLAAVGGQEAEGEARPARSRARRATRAVDVTLAETPQEIPLNDPSLLYNKVMMDLRQQVEGYPGTETAAFARLNLAICAMHFGDFAAAHEHLLKARGGAAGAARPLAGHGPLLPGPGPRAARLQEGGGGRLPRRRRLQGRDALQQRRAGGGAAGRAPGRDIERASRAPRLDAAGRRRRRSFRSPPA